MWSAVSVTIPSSEPDPKSTLAFTPSSMLVQLHWLFTQNKPLAFESFTSASLSVSETLRRAVDGFEGCHCICGPRGAALTTGGGALLHLALWVRGSRDNAAVNTPDGDLWVLWKFNVTLRATCAHWGQRWARPGGNPRLLCVGALETKCQWGGQRVPGLVLSPVAWIMRHLSAPAARRDDSLSHLKRAQVTYLICPRQARDMIWSRGAFSLNVLWNSFLISFCSAPYGCTTQISSSETLCC